MAYLTTAKHRRMYALLERTAAGIESDEWRGRIMAVAEQLKTDTPLHTIALNVASLRADFDAARARGEV